MSELELFGREEEVSILRSCFQRVTKTDGGIVKFDANFTTEIAKTDKELVFVRGQSGVGKSALTRSVIKDIYNLDNGLFVEGKFDLITSNEPYSGVAKAFSTMCRQLLSLSEEAVSIIGDSLSKELGGEVQNLLPLIPELCEIIGLQKIRATQGGINDAENRSLENRHERWKYAFRLLSRALNSVFSPIVVVLDDLQWADVSSLQVIDYLVSDMQNLNQLMIIGCYRSEEVNEGDVLSRNIDRLKKREGAYGFNLTEIALNSCQLDDVNKIIMTKLGIEDEKETLELARLCYRRTLGNPFFVLQIMTMLEKENLVVCNKSRYTWDIDKIKERAHFMSDVVDLLQGRMRKMSESVQLLLQYAACIGSSFTLETIDSIWQEHGTGQSEALGLLQDMQDEDFIEPYEGGGYKWFHDKVQESALSLSDIVNEESKFKIGKTLVSALNDEQLDDKLFDVVDLINHGKVTMRPDLAELNLRAAKKAHGLSAFYSASRYVESAIALLPRDPWTSHRNLTLNLFTLGTKLELTLGHKETASTYFNTVVDRHDVSVMEKLPLRMALIEKKSLGEAEEKKEALAMSLVLLRELGYPIVWKKGIIPLQTIHGLVSAVKKVKKWARNTGKDARLPEMTDPKYLTISRLLERVGFCSYHLELMFLSGLSVSHQAKITLKHGKNDLSGVALVGIGFMSWAVLKEDFHTALTCVQGALSIQDSLDPRYACQSRWTGHVLCLYWNLPFESCIDQALEFYGSAMKVGDIEYGSWSFALLHCWLPYVMGRPLTTILKACPKLISSMEELGQTVQATVVKMWFQMVQNMANSDGIVEQLEGSTFSAKHDTILTTGPFLGNVHLLAGELLLLSNIDLAAERAIRHGDKYQKLLPGVFLGMVEMFHRGIALYAAARRHKKRKFRKGASKIRKTVKQWIKDGNPNVEHYDLLLDAEHAALKSNNYEKADRLYQASIESAFNIGHLMHSGLCIERYADFLSHNGSSGAAYQLSEAIRLYELWGAVGKVNQLKLQMKSQTYPKD